MEDIWPTVVALTIGVLAIPICYIYTLLCDSLSTGAMLALAAGIMTGIVAITFSVTKKKVKNKMYYGFALFVFSGVIDLLSGLEMDGIVNGFLTLYLKHGEPYLMSAWGAMASYWDGTGFQICYLIMAYLSSNGRSYRAIGLHWSSSILNSMIVLLLGACLSKSGMSWCTVLNIPYVLFPLAVAVQCLAEPPSHLPQKVGKSSWIDKVLVVLLIEAAVAALLKGLATFPSDQLIPAWYRKMAEPILEEVEPAPFAAIQGLITLFYYLPAYVAIAWGISINPGQKWLLDLSLILAGATLQAGVSTIGMVFHQLTQPEHRLPQLVNHSAYCAFWAVNLLICIVPQITALRLLYLPVKSNPVIQQKRKNTKKIKEN